MSWHVGLSPVPTGTFLLPSQCDTIGLTGLFFWVPKSQFLSQVFLGLRPLPRYKSGAHAQSSSLSPRLTLLLAYHFLLLSSIQSRFSMDSERHWSLEVLTNAGSPFFPERLAHIMLSGINPGWTTLSHPLLISVFEGKREEEQEPGFVLGQTWVPSHFPTWPCLENLTSLNLSFINGNVNCED